MTPTKKIMALTDAYASHRYVDGAQGSGPDHVDARSKFARDSLHDAVQALVDERDAMRAEVERLTTCLKQANEQSEEFERKCYLATDEIEKITASATQNAEAAVQAEDERDALSKELAELRLQQSELPDEWNARGLLAKSLKCWHRLTEEESDELAAFVVAVQPKAEPVRPQNCGTGFCSCIECVMDEPTVKESLTVAEPVQEPFGIWHQADDPDECEFYLWKDSGDVSCPSCIKLYAAPQDGLRKAAQMALKAIDEYRNQGAPTALWADVQKALRKELGK